MPRCDFPVGLKKRAPSGVTAGAYAVDTEDGILITPYDPNFAKAMEIAERGSKKFRNALRELAK